MRLSYSSFVPLGALLLGGCLTTPYQRVAGPVTRGSAATFSAIVPHSTTPSRCEVRESALGGPGGRAITLVHGRPAEQRITVIVDYEGRPVRYTDVRGDVSTSDDYIGDRTTIGLDLVEGFAVASNRSQSEEPVVFEIPYIEASASANLGHPRETLERVLMECDGTPSGVAIYVGRHVAALIAWP